MAVGTRVESKSENCQLLRRDLWLLVAVLCAVVFSVVFAEDAENTPVPHAVHMGGMTYSVEVAVTDAERARGLSGRAALCQTCGMLFLFEKPGEHAFWMKDMRFPLDIVWLLGDKVVFVAHEVTHERLEILSPAAVADRVLEVNAGMAEDVKAGDAVIFSD